MTSPDGGITLKRTSPAQRQQFLHKANYHPASYDVFVDGERVGRLEGYSHPRLSDAAYGHHLVLADGSMPPGSFSPRGEGRKRLEKAIREHLEGARRDGPDPGPAP